MITQSVRDSAVRKRDAASAEVARWDDFIRMLDEIERADNEDGVPAISKGLGLPKRQARVALQHGALVRTEEAAVAALRSLGRPIPTRELLGLVTAAGISVGGLDPVATLSARLSRSRLVQNVRPNGWKLREVHEEIESSDHNPHPEVSEDSLFQPIESGERPAGGGT